MNPVEKYDPDTERAGLASFETFLGEAIKLHRLSALFTQCQLAERISAVTGETVRQSDISKFENGNVSLRTLYRVAAALHVSLSDLVRTAEFKSENSGKSDEEYMEQLREALLQQVGKLFGESDRDLGADEQRLSLAATQVPR